MEEMSTELSNLVQAIKNSDVYIRYHKAKEELHKDPELERRVHEFRKKTFQIQNSGSVNLFDEADRLEQETVEFQKIPVVGEYLTAELALCRVVQRASWRLIDALDFELGF